MSLPSVVFMNTRYAMALLSRQDQYHTPATALAGALAKARTRLVTTQAVFLELGVAFSKPAIREIAVQFIIAFAQEPLFEIVPITDLRFQHALTLFASRPDKAWSLADCLSFVVMRESGMTAALTTDMHFEQAGFVALLRTVSGSH
ncbi:MAG: type II toxin-antitoxin system VapC family toxin [Candidatus Competibacteraceae bacterium]|nr:type II toxin-antitoxin system VapC family toxin [Candidatus Competibacteraceae bacterium]